MRLHPVGTRYIRCPVLCRGRTRARSAMGVFGRYPREYNPKVHGPYLPSRYYGKPDTPFGQVKVGELGAWFGRRNKSPESIWSAIHRGYWRWATKNLHVRQSGFVPYGQAAMVLSIFYFFLLYKERSYHKHCKYH